MESALTTWFGNRLKASALPVHVRTWLKEFVWDVCRGMYGTNYNFCKHICYFVLFQRHYFVRLLESSALITVPSFSNFFFTGITNC